MLAVLRRTLSAFAHAVAVNIGCVGLETAQENAFAAHIVSSVNAGVTFEDGTQIVRAVVFVFLILSVSMVCGVSLMSCPLRVTAASSVVDVSL